MRRAFCFSRKLGQVLRTLALAVTAVHARREGAGLTVRVLGDGALHREAALTLQVELGALASTESAHGSGITSHFLP